MNNELSRAALMAVAGGVIAGVSFIAGKREGSTIGKKKMEILFELGRLKGILECDSVLKEVYEARKGNEEGK